MSKAKDQGTRYETAIVKRLNEHYGVRLVDHFKEPPPKLPARRVAEGGIADLGDIELELGDKRLPLIIEAKHRQALNLHQTVSKANSKAGLSRSVVFWKKLTRKAGQQRRTPDGVAEVVAMDVDTFLWLLDGMP